MDLFNYMQDGACPAARAVLAYLQSESTNIQASWNKEYHCYDARFEIGRWENCREQGYIVSLKNKDHSQQLNIAFFEHRNSNDICCIKWLQYSINSLSIDTMDTKGEVYNTKWDVSKSFNYDGIIECANWIAGEFRQFWNTTKKDYVVANSILTNEV